MVRAVLLQTGLITSLHWPGSTTYKDNWASTQEIVGPDSLILVII